MSGERDDALAETMMSPEPALDRTATSATAPDPTSARVAAASRQLGRYTLERELGSGGMGVVYAAMDSELGRRLAVKLIFATNVEARVRLLREAQAMARLQHPNVAIIFDVGSIDGRDYVAMELVDGGSLIDWLRERPRSEREIVEAFVAAGRGLAAAHEAGIVHRDFKPHNVLRSKAGRIAVADFGLACGLGAPPEETRDDKPVPATALVTLTATGSWIGTPAYMAPEQWNGGEVTPATDQFAFCIALWEAFAGDRPFHGNTIAELRAAAIAGPANLDATRVPRRLRAVLRRGMDPDPAKRWPSMAALIAKLEPKRPTAYIVATVAAVALVAIAIAVAVLRQPPKPPEAKDQIEAFVQKQIAEALKGSGALELDLEDSDANRARVDALRALELAEKAREVANRTRGNDSVDLATLRQIRRFTDGRVTASRAALRAVIEELRRGNTARFVPTVADGKPVGVKLYALVAGTFLDAIGLSNGDLLVAIDGIAITGPLADRMRAPRRDTSKLELELRRDGKPFSIVVSVPDE